MYTVKPFILKYDVNCEKYAHCYNISYTHVMSTQMAAFSGLNMEMLNNAWRPYYFLTDFQHFSVPQ